MSNVSDIAAARHPEKANHPATQMQRKPDWIRVKAPTAGVCRDPRADARLKLNTVCEEAACPNIGECWKQKHATVMILGSGLHPRLRLLQRRDRPARPARPARAGACGGGRWAKLGLSHVVVTSVDRDDLDDGGAEHFARVIRRIRDARPAPPSRC